MTTPVLSDPIYLDPTITAPTYVDPAITTPGTNGPTVTPSTIYRPGNLTPPTITPNSITPSQLTPVPVLPSPPPPAARPNPDRPGSTGGGKTPAGGGDDDWSGNGSSSGGGWREDHDYSGGSSGSSSSHSSGSGAGSSSNSNQGGSGGGRPSGGKNPSGGGYSVTPSPRPDNGGNGGNSNHGYSFHEYSNGSYGLSVNPVLLDLSGNGLDIDPLSSSSQFFDLDGSGYLHRMAGPGAGTGMLVLDANGDGQISDASEFIFTNWDRSATGDLEALRNVFDTNGNGKLDAGDDRWSQFRVMVDGALTSLDALGIASIDLRPTGSGQQFSDGSSIGGTTVFTRTDGTTGTVGDAVLAGDRNGYLIKRGAVENADGSTTEDIFGYTPDGRLAFRNLITRSAGGGSSLTQFDDDGNGTFDRAQQVDVSVDAGGSRTRTVANLNADGSLRDRTVTVTGAGGLTVTTGIDQDGDGLVDQRQLFVTNADGSSTTVTSAFAADGGLLRQVTVFASADGLGKTTAIDENGDGTDDTVVLEQTTIGGDGRRTEIVETRNADGSLRSMSSTVTSADGRSKTVTYDHDGDGTVDERQEIRITPGAGSSTTTEIASYSADGTLRGREETTTSADGVTQTRRSDLDGDGTVDRTAITVRVPQADGGFAETESVTSGDGTLLSRVVTTKSADGRQTVVEADTDGDNVFDLIRTTMVEADGSSREETINLSAAGTLTGRTVTQTAADGLSWTRTIDLDGNGAIDRVETAAIVANADGSRTETVILTAAGGSRIGQTVTTTSADSLTQTVRTDLDGDGIADVIADDRIALNADGSRLEVLKTTSADGTLLGSTTTTVSADRQTTSVAVDADGDGISDRTTTETIAADGSRTVTGRRTAADGTLLGQSVVTDSGDGLVRTTLEDADGDGDFDWQSRSETSLGPDGSRTQTQTVRASDGTLLERTVSTVSDDGFEQSSKSDVNGDGVIDFTANATTHINADGSVTTISSQSAGTSQTGRTTTTASANGLGTVVAADLDGNGSVDRTTSRLKRLNADGSVVETVSLRSGDNSLIAQTATTVSGDRRTVLATTDLDGDLVNDVTRATTINDDGSSTSATSTYDDGNGAAQLQSRSVTTISADGLSVRTETDLNADGIVDQANEAVTVLRADGSTLKTVRELAAYGAVKNRTVVETSANGLSQTTQWSATGSAVTRSRTDTTDLNADGSTVRTEVFFKADNALESRTVTSVSADRKTTVVTADVDGDGIVDQRSVSTVNADGSLKTILSDLGADGVTVIGTKTITTDGTGLSRATDYDTDGDGVTDIRTVTTKVMNADGSTTETMTHQQEKAMTAVSADGLAVTSSWDLDGDTVVDRSRSDVTVLNADGSKTQTVRLSEGATVIRQTETTASANGLSTTRRWDLDGDGIYDQSATDVTVLNRDGSTTRTVTSMKAGGVQIGQSIETASADGRTVSVYEDRSGFGLDNRSLVTSTVTRADGSLTETLSVADIAGQLAERQTVTTSADGRELDIVRDADGDGDTDQSETSVRYVDGSQKTVITGYKDTGARSDATTIVTSADGLTTTTEWDLDANGSLDRRRTTVLVVNADGSTRSVATDTTAYGVVLRTATTQISADERSRIVSRDIDGDGDIDSTETSLVDMTGAMVSTIVNNEDARELDNLIAGEVYWKRAIAVKSETTVSADGLTRTVRSDFDGNGTFEYEAVVTAQIDGSIVSTMTETNPDGTVKARGTRVESADGRVTRLQKDADNDGDTDTIQTAVTHLDGAITATTAEWNASGSLKQTVTEAIDATGKLTHRLTTDAQGRRIAELILNADGTMTDSAYDGASGQLLSVTRLTTEGALSTATLYDPLDDASWARIDQTYAADGNKQTEKTVNDDGTRTHATFTAGKLSHAYQYNAAGALVATIGYHSSGAVSAATYYDLANEETWTRLEQSFNSSGVKLTETQYWDNGEKTSYIYEATKGALTNVHYYAASGLQRHEIFYDPLKASNWSRVENGFDANGKKTFGIWFYDDGTRIEQEYKAADGSLLASRNYNAAGGLSSAKYYDLANEETWTRLEQTFNATGVKTSEKIHKDDGTFTSGSLSSDGTLWLFREYNAADALVRDLAYDKSGGLSSAKYYDLANKEIWTRLEQTFNAAGVKTSEKVRKDDGTFTSGSLSSDGTLWLFREYNAADALVRDLSYDKSGGLSSAKYYDLANKEIWTRLEQTFNAAGVKTWEKVSNDNGTRTEAWFQADGKPQTFREYNAAGALVTDIYYHDSGAVRSATYYDRDNKKNWTRIDRVYNSAGVKLTETQYLDNGEKTSYVYEATKGALTNVHYFAATGLKRHEIFYDPLKAANWSRVENGFDANGKKTFGIWVYDDGTRIEQEYKAADGSLLVSRNYNAAGDQVGLNGVIDTDIAGDPNKIDGWSTGLTGQGKPSIWVKGAYAVDANNGASLFNQLNTKRDLRFLYRYSHGIPPVALDLDADGHIDLRLFDPSAAADLREPRFDWDDDGKRDQTAWIGPRDGLLAIDIGADGEAGGDGVIDQARELAFALWSDSAVLENGPVSDLEGLRLNFDSNHDNVLDFSDARWNEFRVWQDQNQNGISETGELLTLPEAGIKLIQLLPTQNGAMAFDDGSMISGTSSMQMADGTERLVADAVLAYRPSSSAANRLG